MITIVGEGALGPQPQRSMHVLFFRPEARGPFAYSRLGYKKSDCRGGGDYLLLLKNETRQPLLVVTVRAL